MSDLKLEIKIEDGKYWNMGKFQKKEELLKEISENLDKLNRQDSVTFKVTRQELTLSPEKAKKLAELPCENCETEDRPDCRTNCADMQAILRSF